MPKGTVKTVLFVSLLFLMAPAREQSGYKVFETVPLQNCYNVIQIPDSTGKLRYQLEDTTLQGRGRDATHDLVLSLNGKAATLRRDDSGKYKILSAGYLSEHTAGTFGAGCAKFYRKSHRIVIATEESLWLGRCGDLGSFTIEFRFKATSLTDKMVIFSRNGFLSGSRRGLESVIENRKLAFRSHQLFEDMKGFRHDVFLKSKKNIMPGVWYHAALSFNRITGKLTLYLNGTENNASYVTEDKKPGGQVLTPSFGYRNKKGELTCIEAPPAIIGDHFTGYLDEFRIAYGDLPSVKMKSALIDRRYYPVRTAGRTPYNVEGTITSPVYRFSDTGTRVILFNWRQKLPRDTFLWMEFRMADHLFYLNDMTLPWYRIKRNQRNIYLKKTPSGEYVRGKYYQWRAHLIPSPDGERSPQLIDVALRYQADPPCNTSFSGDYSIRG